MSCLRCILAIGYCIGDTVFSLPYRIKAQISVQSCPQGAGQDRQGRMGWDRMSSPRWHIYENNFLGEPLSALPQRDIAQKTCESCTASRAVSLGRHGVRSQLADAEQDATNPGSHSEGILKAY